MNSREADDYGARWWIFPALAFASVLLIYQPILAPIFDRSLGFAYGDFTTLVGNDSGLLRAESLGQTLMNGNQNQDNNRAFLLMGLGTLIGPLGFSDAQVQSITALICMCLGASGLAMLIRRFCGRGMIAALLAISIIPFYFLNIWSIIRIGHFWIWLAYAAMPFVMFIGISYVQSRRKETLLGYSLLVGILGVIPHNLIYLMTIHAFLFIWMIWRKERIADLAAFILVPAAVFILVQLPLLVFPFSYSITYPEATDEGTLAMLSSYGHPLDIIGQTNEWWPMMPIADIQGNMVYRTASIALMCLIPLFLILGFGNLGKEGRLLAALSLCVFAGAMFIAQGENNGLVTSAVQAIKGMGLSMIIGPFREWGRMMLVAPLFMSMMLMISAPAMKRGIALLLILVALVWLSALASPGMDYLTRQFSAVALPQEYSQFNSSFLESQKTLWVSPQKADVTLGHRDYSWDPDKSLGGGVIGEWGAYANGVIMNLSGEEEEPANLLDALDIGHVVIRKDILGGTDYPANYSWLDCTQGEYFTVCRNPDNVTPFEVYDSTLLSTGSAGQGFGIYQLPLRKAAPSADIGDFVGYVQVDDRTATLVQGALNSSGAIILRPSEHVSFVQPESGWLNQSQAQVPQNVLKMSGGYAMFSRWPATMEVSLPAIAPGYYRIFVDALESDASGRIAVIAGGAWREIDTENGSSGFSWADAGSLQVKNGSEKIVVVNEGGTNAIDSIVLLSSADLEAITNISSLPDKKRFYYYEAAQDFSMDNTGNALVLDDWEGAGHGGTG